MHEAYELSQLLKLSVQVESISAYDNKLLIGTRQGHVMMYSITYKQDEIQKHELQLLRCKLLGNKKPIQQIEVIPMNQLLVCLTDNMISVHELNSLNFSVVHQAQKTKGASLFTLHIKESVTDESPSLILLCAVVKRKLQLYVWKNNEFKQLINDISLNDIPRAVVWCQDTICVGFRNEYTLFDLTGESQELFPTSSNKSTFPCITKISDTIFALGRENTTVLVNREGHAETKKAITWTDTPIALVWDDPYVLGLLPDAIEVHTIDPYESIQIIKGLPQARLICRAKQGLIYVASVGQVWCVQAVDVTKQRQHFLENKQFELALKLTEISNESPEDKKQKITYVQTLYAHDLFSKKKFHESMAEFLKLGTDPHEVIRLFPDLLPQHSRGADAPILPNDNIVLKDKDLENGLLALIEYLTEVRHKIQGESSGTKKQTDDNLSSSIEIASSSSPSKSTAQLLQVIDTTLLKCYLQTNDALVAPLIRLNRCHLAETEKTLKKYQKYTELIILYQTKNQHKKALELLQKQAHEPDSSLRGHERTIQYLQHLGADHLNLIFEFSEWVLKDHPEDGLKIFIDDLVEVENLPRPKVLDYLLRMHKNLVIPYLEHVIHVWEDTNFTFHNALIHQYKEKYQELLKKYESSSPDEIELSPIDKQAVQNIKTKLINFLEKSQYYAPNPILLQFHHKDFLHERAIVLGKLGNHEEALSIYVQILGDIDKAIEYCNNVTRKENQQFKNGCGGLKSEDVYIILIKLLLSKDCVQNASFKIHGLIISEKITPDVDTAIKLLNDHAQNISASKILQILPDDIPLYKIHHFIEASLRSKLSERRRTQVIKGLLYAEHLRAQQLRMMYESQKITITDANICLVCKKRFGNQSAFVRYPNGDIVHYSCQDRKNLV